MKAYVLKTIIMGFCVFVFIYVNLLCVIDKLRINQEHTSQICCGTSYLHKEFILDVSTKYLTYQPN